MRSQDVNDKEILDFTSGQMSSILGHSHPEIVKVVSDQIGQLDHLLSSFISEPVADLADLLTSLTPDPLDKTFFLNTGSETNEAALKIAKSATGKFDVIAFASSYRSPSLLPLPSEASLNSVFYSSQTVSREGPRLLLSPLDVRDADR